MQTAIRGLYDLARQSEFFGGWVRTADHGIVMAFPVEGWTHSAAVVVRQRGDTAEGEVYGGSGPAWAQALAVLSLDVNESDAEYRVEKVGRFDEPPPAVLDQVPGAMFLCCGP